MLYLWGASPALRVERVRFTHGNLLIAIGEIDLATVSVLEANLHDLPYTGDVLIDLAEVSFLGAAGLRVLLARARDSRAHGQTFAICALRPQLHRLLARLDLLAELVAPEARRPFYEAVPNAN